MIDLGAWAPRRIASPAVEPPDDVDGRRRRRATRTPDPLAPGAAPQRNAVRAVRRSPRRDRRGASPPSAYTGTRVAGDRRANPSQPSGVASGCVGVARHRPQHREVEVERAGARELGARVAGRRDQHVARAARSPRRACADVQCTPSQRQPPRVVHRCRSAARCAPCATRERRRAAARTRRGARAASPSRATGSAKAALQRALGAHEECVLADVLGAGDAVDRRQQRAPRGCACWPAAAARPCSGRASATRTPGRRARRARRPRRTRERSGARRARADRRIPARATAPRGAPRCRAPRATRASSACARRLAGLELAAGELPVARIGLAGGTLRQQDRAVGRAAATAAAHPDDASRAAGLQTLRRSVRAGVVLARTATRRGRCASRAAAPTAAPRACALRRRARCPALRRRNARASRRPPRGSRPG